MYSGAAAQQDWSEGDDRSRLDSCDGFSWTKDVHIVFAMLEPMGLPSSLASSSISSSLGLPSGISITPSSISTTVL